MKTMKKVSLKWLFENQEFYTHVNLHYDCYKGVYNYYFRVKPSVFVDSKPISVFVSLKRFVYDLIQL